MVGDLAQPREAAARFVPHVSPGRGYGGAEGEKPEIAGDQGIARGEEKLAL